MMPFARTPSARELTQHDADDDYSMNEIAGTAAIHFEVMTISRTASILAIDAAA